MGWNYHQRQERGALPTDHIWERAWDVAAFFCAGAGLDDAQLAAYPACLAPFSNPDTAWVSAYQDGLRSPELGRDWAVGLLHRYGVQYIVVGPLEQAYYPAAGLAKLDALVGQGDLAVAYENPGVVVYAVQDR
jgi:hypothetical protein